MTVAVDVRFFQAGELAGYYSFLQELFSKLPLKYPNHLFIFLTDRLLENFHSLPSNVKVITVEPKTTSELLKQWWLNFKIPSVLTENKADIFVSFEAISFRTNVPQIIITPSQTNASNYTRVSNFFSSYLIRKYFKKAKKVIAFSQAMSVKVIREYQLKSEKLEVINLAAKEIFQPLSWEQKTVVKEKFTEGLEYFLFTSTNNTRDNLLGLLKAFSFSKTRQRTKMKLVVAGSIDKDLAEKLKTYKFRNDVVVLGFLNITDFAEVLSSAYALVYLSSKENAVMPILEALQAEVPVITFENLAVKEIAEGAVMYANANDPSETAEQLKLLYKDEEFRSSLIEQGRNQAAKFNIDNSASQIWKAFERALSK